MMSYANETRIFTMHIFKTRTVRFHDTIIFTHQNKSVQKDVEDRLKLLFDGTGQP